MSVLEDMEAVGKVHEEAKELGKRHDEEIRLKEIQAKPFEFLGEDMAKNYCFYLHGGRDILRAKPSDMGKVTTLIELTPHKEYWDHLDVNLDQKGAIKAHRLFREQKDSLTFNEENIKKEGFWNVNGQCVYNTGKRTFTAGDQGIKELKGIYEGYCFIKGTHSLPIPNEEILDDNAGILFLKYCNELGLKEKHGGELFAGALVQCFIGGFLPFRVHSMINARPGSGKSQVWRNLKELSQNTGDYQTSTTSSGLRNAIDRTSLPVFFDEAQKNENKANKGNKNQGSLDELLSIARIVTTSDGKNVLGVAGGGGMRTELFRSAMMFFCISSPIESQADKERWLEFEMDKPNNEDYSKRDEAFEALRASWDMGKFVTRLLIYADVLLENVRTLKKAFKGGRRSDVFSTILACRHLLTSTQRVNESDIKHYIAIMNESTLAKDEETEEMRLLDHILGCRPDKSVGKTYKEMIIHQRDVARGNKAEYNGGSIVPDPNYKKPQDSASYGMKIVVKDDIEYLVINDVSRDIKNAATGAIGCDCIKQYLLRLEDATTHQCMIIRGEKTRRHVAIPLAGILQDAE